jgi:sterol desaturase/sphingolipid hydroxylase (fatty acid hydroxylase superfamily)
MILAAHPAAVGLIEKSVGYLYHVGWIVLESTVLSPVFVGAVVGILLLQHLKPADSKQKTFGVGFLHDGVWVILAVVFEGTFLIFYTKALKVFYTDQLSFLTVEAFVRLPAAARFILGIFLADFLAWFQHWVKHKVPWFWEMHAVHHSQRELNLFTDFRFHYLEYLISRPLVMIPLFILANDVPKIAAYSLFTTWFPRLYHANIRSNFGWLRYIFVSPQSHRVHHSVEERHRDRNFGVIFSIWDRLLGTQYADCREYPETGIVDPAFPLEKEASPSSLLVVPLRQMLYPFIAIGRSLSTKNPKA